MFCKYCGSEIADSSKFCDKCGKPVDTQASSQTIPVSSTTSANNPPKKHKKIKFAILGILLTVIIVVSIPLIKINCSGISRGYSASTTFSQIQTMEKFHFDSPRQPCNIEYMPIQEKEWNDEKGIFEYYSIGTDKEHIFSLAYKNVKLYNVNTIGMVLKTGDAKSNKLGSITYYLTEEEYDKLISKHTELSVDVPFTQTPEYQIYSHYCDTEDFNSRTDYNMLGTTGQPGYAVTITFYH